MVLLFGYRKMRLWIEEQNVVEKKKAKEKLSANREKVIHILKTGNLFFYFI